MQTTSKFPLGVLLALSFLSLSTSVSAQLPTVIPTGTPLLNITYTLGFTEGQPHVVFELRAATKGFVGFGFSNNTCMTESDALVTWMDWSNNSLIIVQDWTFLTTGFPYDKFEDDQQDWTIQSFVWNEDQSSTITVHRLYNTGDPWDIVIEDKTMNLIYAVGEFPALHAHQIGRSGNIRFNIVQGVPFYEG